MKNVYFLFIIIFMFLMQSCIVTQEFTFDKDFSGNAAVSIDVSKLNGVLKKYNDVEGSALSKIIGDSIRSRFNKFNELNVIKDFKYEIKSGPVIDMSYKFTDLEGNNLFFKFTKNDKIVNIDFFPKSKLLMPAMGKYVDLFQINTVINFPEKIKSVNLENAKISNHKKTITFGYQLSTLPNETIEIKLK